MILTDKSELGDFSRSFRFCKLREGEGEGGGGWWKVVMSCMVSIKLHEKTA
jgi:hypothetical protein